MKVLPTMHIQNRDTEHSKLSMIQNIAIPSVFKIKNIRSFYADPHNELFKFPMMQYQTTNRSNSSHKAPKDKNKNSSSPLQKITNSISSKIGGMSFLSPHTPPIAEQQMVSNLDDLILPPTFFNDDASESKNQEKVSKIKKYKHLQEKGRGRSQSLDALPAVHQKLISPKHLIHGL